MTSNLQMLSFSQSLKFKLCLIKCSIEISNNKIDAYIMMLKRKMWVMNFIAFNPNWSFWGGGELDYDCFMFFQRESYDQKRSKPLEKINLIFSDISWPDFSICVIQTVIMRNILKILHDIQVNVASPEFSRTFFAFWFRPSLVCTKLAWSYFMFMESFLFIYLFYLLSIEMFPSLLQIRILFLPYRSLPTFIVSLLHFSLGPSNKPRT